jgi:3-hydroxyacyl-[acyl-carrier-protein] dehydratase
MQMLTKNLYRKKALSDTSWEVTLTEENHPVFLAHFEGNPLLPAFLQIDIFAEIVNKELNKIERCKFKQPILPNDVVIYEVVKQTENRYRVNIKKGETLCSELKINFK